MAGDDIGMVVVRCPGDGAGYCLDGILHSCRGHFPCRESVEDIELNSRVRAFNGFLAMLFIFTSVFTLLNFNNFTFYVPLLNCLGAYQVGHFFTYRRHRRSYIAILLLMACYVGLYVWAVA